MLLLVLDVLDVEQELFLTFVAAVNSLVNVDEMGAGSDFRVSILNSAHRRIIWLRFEIEPLELLVDQVYIMRRDLEVDIFELLVLVQEGSSLHIIQDQLSHLLEIEVIVALIGVESLILVDCDEYFGIAPLLQLVGPPKEASFFLIERLIPVLLFFWS